MKINRLVDLEEYEAKGHFDIKGFRMQGFDALEATCNIIDALETR